MKLLIMQLKMELKETEYVLDSSGSGQCPVAGSCKNDNELPASTKGRGFLAQLNDYQHVKRMGRYVP
jgi:hypothetical protein